MRFTIITSLTIFLVAPAMAQTTQTTICNVAGKSIICRMADAQANQQLTLQQQALAESIRRAQVEKFAAEISTPDVWTSLQTDFKYHVRMDGEHITFLLIPPRLARRYSYQHRLFTRRGKLDVQALRYVSCEGQLEVETVLHQHWRTPDFSFNQPH